jgi:hypothetical protein
MAKRRPVPPTERQLEYLEILGWHGPQPQTMRDASALIDQLKERRDEQRRESKQDRGRARGCVTGVGCVLVLVILAIGALVVVASLQP